MSIVFTRSDYALTKVSLDSLSMFSNTFDEHVVINPNETRVPPRKSSKVVNDLVGSIVGMFHLFIREVVSPCNAFDSIYKKDIVAI